ncbi:MAG: aldo/keto reductase, partial [Acidobacteria bacterium]|nr:aldo/keto reductase [Acidobacteriota bacterium]
MKHLFWQRVRSQMTAFATVEGTHQFAARFQGRLAPGSFRPRQDLLLSSLGIGTYLGEPDAATDLNYAEAIFAAVSGGINVIDSAINYRFQRSERSIGTAISRLAEAGISREELIICTKGGFLTPDGEMPADPSAYFARQFLQTGILQPRDVVAGCHAISPRYLEDQLNASLRNLGLQCVDVYYLHNPETQLSAVTQVEFGRRVRAAFEFLESAVECGKIRHYGVATWNGFRLPCRSPDSVSLPEMETWARQIAGDNHHFRFVQLPCNLGMTQALTLANQPVGNHFLSIAEVARKLDITLIASASLFQSRLTRNLPSFIAELLGQESDAQRALQFARSVPGITTALVGMSQV